MTAHDESQSRRPAVELAALTLRYPSTEAPAVDSVSFRLEPGEAMALVGASGSGKTSLLRLLEGSQEPSSGTIERGGKASLVYQDRRLVPQRTVLDNVTSGALADQGPWSLRAAPPLALRGRDLLQELGLAELEDRRVGTLSGGQQQRVAIARALCSRPALLLADEPLAALDPGNAARVLDLFDALRAKHGFALIVTIHDVALAQSRFSRIAVMDRGRLEPYQADRHRAALFDAAGEATGSQDRALAGRPAAWVKRASWVAPVVVAAALVWALTGLELDGAIFTGMVSSLWQFLRSVVPNGVGALAQMPAGTLFGSLVETVQMAIVGTAIGIVVALPLAVLASEQTAPRPVRVPTRFLLNVIRTVPSIFWALIFVAMVGLGPAAGVAALGAYSVGYLTKFFYEALEDVDARSARALRALGLSRFQCFFVAVLPAAGASLLAACFFVLEYNIRGASILGVVGAGGIGQDLMYYIEWRQFPTAALALAMLLVIVVSLDFVSQWLRRRLGVRRGT